MTFLSHYVPTVSIATGAKSESPEESLSIFKNKLNKAYDSINSCTSGVQHHYQIPVSNNYDHNSFSKGINPPIKKM